MISKKAPIGFSSIKIKYTTAIFIFLLLICCTRLSAQQTYQRLLDLSSDYYSNGAFAPSDSERFSYSGTRGGGGYYYPGQPQQFDLALSFFRNSGAWYNGARLTDTYDAQNRMLSSIRETSSDGTTFTNSTKEIDDYSTNHTLEDSVMQYSGMVPPGLVRQRQ